MSTALIVLFYVSAGVILALFIFGSIKESKKNLHDLERHYLDKNPHDESKTIV
jgi:hypothetical protein